MFKIQVILRLDLRLKRLNLALVCSSLIHLVKVYFHIHSTRPTMFNHRSSSLLLIFQFIHVAFSLFSCGIIEFNIAQKVLRSQLCIHTLIHKRLPADNRLSIELLEHLVLEKTLILSCLMEFDAVSNPVITQNDII